MKLSKAIEIGKDDMHGDGLNYSPDLPAARWLLIEAGKRIHAIRNHQSYSVHPLLPGETED